LERFFAGQLSVDDAAVQVAPFLLMRGGFGFELPPDVDPNWHERSEALTEKIVKLHTENRR
jgi:hypothetical protein